MEKEVNCINTKAILNYLSDHSDINIHDFLADLHPELDMLPDKASFLRDPNNWITSEVASELYRRAKVAMKDDDIPYKIARYAVTNTSLGYIQRIFIKAFWSLQKSYKNAQKINDKLNRNKKVELMSVDRNGAVIRLHWNSRMKVSKDICQYNKGIYTYIPLIWGSKNVELHERCCYFDGGPYCEYIVKWPARNRINEIFSRFFSSKSVLAETIEEMERDKQLLEKKYEEVNFLNIQLNEKVKQLQAVQETGKAILSVLNLEKLLHVIMSTLSNVCMINRAIIMIVNEKEDLLEYLYATGFDNVPDEVKNYRISLDRVNNLLARVTNTGRSEYIPDVGSSILRKENIVLMYGKPSSVFAVPLITRSKVIGVIATDSVGRTGVPEETRNTLEIFAPQIAIAIENARLYKRLQEQMAELKKSHALLSRTEKLAFLGDLAARLAHEIKNPMTAIGTFIQMMPYKIDDEEYRVNFHKIALEETERVNNLISELLDLVNTRESRFESNSIHEIIDKMILLVSPKSKVKKITVEKDFDAAIKKVWIDSEKIKQVILNLLSNSVEFTPEHGLIKVVTSRITESKNGLGIRITVEDNGEGIPENLLNKIFDPYFSTKHKSNEHSGTGLGLFIVHQNIQDHCGTIEVKSRINEGTKFIIDLPVHPQNIKNNTGKL